MAAATLPPLRALPVADAARLSPELLGAVYLAREEVKLLAGLQHCLLQCGVKVPRDLLQRVLVVLERREGGLVLRRVACVLPDGDALEVEGEGPVGISQLSTLGPPDADSPSEGLGPHAEALVQEACWQWCHRALPIHSSRHQLGTTYLRLDRNLHVATAEVDADLAVRLGATSAEELSEDLGCRTKADVLRALLARDQELQRQKQPQMLLRLLLQQAALLAQHVAAELAWQPSEPEVAEAAGLLMADGAAGGEWCALQAMAWQSRAACSPCHCASGGVCHQCHLPAAAPRASSL